jgi:hypothetical protein
MIPKDKARELVSNFYSINSKLIIVKNGYDMGDRYNLVMPIAKQCALIAVDELIEHLQPACEFGGEINKYTIEYWQEVKQEINNL